MGHPAARLLHAHSWLQALLDGALPPADADFGDAEALAPMRQAVGTLGLPALARGVPAVAEQVLRTLFWHLDRIADLQPRHTRAQAVAHAAAGFQNEWALASAGLEERLRLLQGLGDLSLLRWDDLQGRLAPRDWQAARRAAEWLAQLPALAELIRRLGRAERAADGPAPPPPQAEGGRRAAGVRAVQTVLPGAPGEITGIRFTARPERMLASEALMLHHPVLRKLWRARQAEARLLGHDTEARLLDWRADPQAPPREALRDAPPEARERGPVIVCLDTSGSMRGAPENIAKACVIAALRAAHAGRRGCVLIAFGGADEIVEHVLGTGGDGLAALLQLMGQGFDGGTDIQAPIERAIERVHQAHWRDADLLLVTDGEFGCVPHTLDRLDAARATLGLRVQGILVGDRETMGMLEVCDDIHWVRDWRRYADAAEGGDGKGYSPVHSKSLTALYFPGALSKRAAKRGDR